MLKLVEILVNVGDDLANVTEASGLLALSDGVELILRRLKHVGYLVLLGISRVGYLIAHRDELTKSRLVLDYLCVVLYVLCVGHSLRDDLDIFLAARL